ncbi:unnamed protein product, partial [Trichogramma brassicae]
LAVDQQPSLRSGHKCRRALPYIDLYILFEKVSLNNSAAVLVCYGYCCCCRCRMQTLSIRETHRDKSERVV